MTLTGGLLHVVAWAVLAVQGPAYVTEVVGEPQRFEAEMTLKVLGPKLSAKEWVVFAAKPPNVAGQTVQASALTPDGKADHELSPLHRPILWARVPATDAALQKEIAVRVTLDVTLQKLRLVEAGKATTPAPVAELSETARKLGLSPSRLVNFKSAGFQKWLDEHKLRRPQGENEVDFGRRVFLEIAKNFKYDYHSTLNRHADNVCKVGQSDCGGLSVVFVGAMRANQVPARIRVGRWAQSQKPGEKLADVAYGQEHAIAEFYAPGAGWVVVDCASGLADRTPVPLQHFGHFRANFITLHLGHDLVLDTVHFGKETVTWMQGIMYWVSGSGSLAGLTKQEDWRVRKLP